MVAISFSCIISASLKKAYALKKGHPKHRYQEDIGEGCSYLHREEGKERF
jgi:hypothetical protein